MNTSATEVITKESKKQEEAKKDIDNKPPVTTEDKNVDSTGTGVKPTDGSVDQT